MEGEVIPVSAESAKKPRKTRAKARKPVGPRKAAAKMQTFIGLWVDDSVNGTSRFEVTAKCQPGDVAKAASALEPGTYDTLTARMGSVSVEEKRRKAVTIG